MNKVIAVANSKGGVGKTNIALHLAIGLGKAGFKVLLIDADPQRSLTKCLGYEAPVTEAGIEKSLATLMLEYIHSTPEKGPSVTASECVIKTEEDVFLLPAGEKLLSVPLELFNSIGRESVLKEVIEEIRNEYDYIFIDSNPAQDLLLQNIVKAADSVLIPINPEYLAESGLEQFVMMMANYKFRLNRNLQFEGVVLTMYNRSHKNGKALLAEVVECCSRTGFLNAFNTFIPRSVVVADANQEEVSIYRFKPSCAATRAFIQLTLEFLRNNRKGITEEELNGYSSRILENLGKTRYVPTNSNRTIILDEEELAKYFPKDWSAERIRKELTGMMASFARSSSDPGEE